MALERADLWVAAAALVAAFLLLLALRWIRRARRRRPIKPIKGLQKLVDRGDQEGAAQLLLRHGRLQEAKDMYLRAQLPARAAEVAARLGEARLAGELYERAGNTSLAAHFYAQAGLKYKAEELRSDRAAAARRSSPADPVAETGAGEPRERARRAEQAFREARRTSGVSAVDRARIQELARQAAQAHLAIGQIRLAADLYREAGLDDEAIHLYVNVLGQPGDAAPLVAARGNHERAAQLYEQAGQRERAAAAWVQVARRGADSEELLRRIARLAPDVGLSYLRERTAGLPIDQDNAALHYMMASLLEQRGEQDRARELWVALQAKLGAYRDVAERLRREPAQRPAAPAAAPALDTGDPAASAAIPEPAARAPMVIQQLILDRELKPGELAALAREAAGAAGAAAPLAEGVVSPPDRVQLQLIGLERAPIPLERLLDAPARAARGGPSAKLLEQRLGGRRCGPDNVELYYQLGLARLAQAQWTEALECFAAVERVRPGFRDAGERAEAIRAWERAIGPRRSGLGGGQAGAAGRYELRGELGRGGMAVVYRAHDRVLGRDVALKFISEKHSHRDEMATLFQREAQAIARLNHPNIVVIHDFGQLEGRWFICMEYLDGLTLQQRLEQQGALGVAEAIEIVQQLLAALEYAHARRIIHRDVKPSNVMLLANGPAKLMDFGLARPVETEGTSSVIQGTPPYMAPEQIRGQPVDGRADLFAVGATLYQLLTGQRPFQGLDRSTAPAPLRRRLPAAPAILEKVLQRALEIEPDNRLPSAAVLREGLRLAADRWRFLSARARVDSTVDLAAPAAEERGRPAKARALPIRWPGAGRRALLALLGRRRRPLVEGRELLDGAGAPLVLFAERMDGPDAAVLMRALPASLRRRIVIPRFERELRIRRPARRPSLLDGLERRCLPAVMLEREGGDQALLDFTSEAVERGFCPLLFPDRRDGRESAPLPDWIGWIARWVAVPIVPAAIAAAGASSSVQVVRFGAPLRSLSGDTTEIVHRIQASLSGLGGSDRAAGRRRPARS